ncbi:MAG: radical SAM protein [Lachnospiraceae bacterium]|nr:radical SAM protein [Lachnospiraceae bacterium]
MLALQEYNYIELEDVIQRLGSEEFEDIVRDRVILLESVKVVKARYMEAFAMRNYKKRITRVYINLTNRCNSDCVYCFASAQRTGADLDYNMVLEALPKVFANCGKKISICFFGGEPTLKFDLIRQIVSYIEKEFSEFDVSYDMVTNGIELSRDKMCFVKDKFNKLTVSIDGGYEYMLNSRVRDRKKLDMLYENVREACKIFDRTSIRATITEKTTNIVDSYTFFKNLGAKNIRFKPVSGCSEEAYMIRDWRYVFEQMRQLAKVVETDISSGTVRLVFPFSMYMNQFKRHCTKITGCNMNIVTIGQKGDIYPCYRFADDRDFVLDPGQDKWGEKIPLNLVDDKSECARCWCRYICGGGCYADSLYYMGDWKQTYRSHCGYIRESIKLSLYMYKNIEERHEENSK